MKKLKTQRSAKILISIGLILVAVPMLFNGYTNFPDFPKGIILGIGLVMEFTGLITLVRLRKNSSCRF